VDAGYFSVTVQVDRPRELRIDFNVLCEVEKVTGLNLLLDPQAALSAQGVRALCWCAWRRSDPTLTMDQAGIIVGAYLPKVLAAVTSAITAAYPMKDDQEEAPDPQTAPLLG